jgi:glycosyltransferase involved in cell wall biosynthesis
MEVNYRGDLVAPSGYSRAIRAHMRALIEAGVKVHGDHSPHDQTALGFEGHPFWREYMPEVLGSRKTCPIKIWHETPEFYEPDPTQYNIAYVVWETSRIIDYDIDGNPRLNWVKQMNRMDEIWTSAEFCKKVYQECGVTVPIYVFPHPADLEAYQPEGDKYTIVHGRQDGLEGKMVFLSVFQFTKRKNPHDLLTAWTAEFGQQEDVALVIKTYGSDFADNNKLKDFIGGLRLSCRIPNMVQNVWPVFELVPEENMAALYRLGDVFVLPSYGEGFGMPYQEAMACGRPVIYTEATAMPEFCVGWSVKCDPEPVYGMLNIPWYSAAQDWWKVRPAELRKALRNAYDAWKSGEIEDCKDLARKKVEELHSYATVGADMRERLEGVYQLIRDGAVRSELAMWGPL